MAFRLPPLSTLRFFEAAGRLLSFKEAAKELNVTPSAVSHAIQTLENWLEVQLFERDQAELRISDAGAAYLPLIREALSTLSDATDMVPGRKARGTLSVSVAPTFATYWLMPRLSRFAEMFPEVVVTIDTDRRQVDLLLAGVDLVIRMAREPRYGGTWLRLVREKLIPVASPSLLRQFPDRTPEELLRNLPLIHVTTVTSDWVPFFGDRDLPPKNSSQELRFDTLHMALQAARQGLGIVLGRRPLIDDDLWSGALREVGVREWDAGISYWLVGLDATFDRPEVKAFRRWLLREIDTSASRKRTTA